MFCTLPYAPRAARAVRIRARVHKQNPCVVSKHTRQDSKRTHLTMSIETVSWYVVIYTNHTLSVLCAVSYRAISSAYWCADDLFTIIIKHVCSSILAYKQWWHIDDRISRYTTSQVVNTASWKWNNKSPYVFRCLNGWYLCRYGQFVRRYTIIDLTTFGLPSKIQFWTKSGSITAPAIHRHQLLA